MLLRRITTGLRRHPFRWLIEAAVIYGFGWSLLEPAFTFLAVKPPGVLRFGILVGVSLLVGLYRALPPPRISARLPASNTQLSIEFGDLFLSPGIRAVPVNEFFDSQLGAHVSPQSLHGQLIGGPFGGHPDAFDRQVSASLQAVSTTEVPRASGNSRRYPIGTTVELQAAGARYLAFALSRTDISSLKASATVPDLWDALAGLWAKAREVASGDAVYVPLAGAGLSGVGLPPQHLLAIVVMSAVVATKQSRIAGSIVIVLSPADIDQVDLRATISLTE